MKKRKVYIAGKIGNLPFDQVQRKFEEAKLELIKMGYAHRIPLEFSHNHGRSWAEYMLEDLTELNKCDAICMLPCWEDSPGAKIEHDFAVGAGKHVLIYEDLQHF
jgi:hypothetical protein